jgi:casein kinase II subunit beta
LYGLIHARYLLTVAGAQKIKDKFEKRKFGVCPRAFCRSQALLPIGLDPRPGRGRVMTYCPCCRDLYDPGVELDGAFFGPSFPHFFVQALDVRAAFEHRVPTPLTVFGVPVATSPRCVHSLPDE